MYRTHDADLLEGLGGFAVPTRPEGFQSALCAYLRRITYKVMSSPEDIREIGRLRYESYRAMNLVGESPGGDWVDRFDADPGHRNIAAFVDGRLVGGIRINLITQTSRVSAVADMYPEHVDDLLSRGSSCVEATRFFTLPDRSIKDRLLPFAIIRLVGVAARHHRVSHVVKNVQENHAPFYRRHLRAEIVPGSLKPYKDHSRVVPLVLLTASVAPSYSAMLTNLQYLLSTRREMEALFSPRPSSVHVQPGTIQALEGSEDWA